VIKSESGFRHPQADLAAAHYEEAVILVPGLEDRLAGGIRDGILVVASEELEVRTLGHGSDAMSVFADR